MANVRVRQHGDLTRASRILKRLAKIAREKDSVLVGLPKDSAAYPNGTSVVMVGAVHEFGSDARNIPERSYLRSTANEERFRLRKFWRKQASKISRGEVDPDRVLNLLGQLFQSAVQQKITDIKSPPNSTKTVNSKGSSNPLIDTGHLRASIRYEIRKR